MDIENRTNIEQKSIQNSIEKRVNLGNPKTALGRFLERGKPSALAPGSVVGRAGWGIVNLSIQRKTERKFQDTQPGGIYHAWSEPITIYISDVLTHSRTVPGWCGDEGEVYW